MKYQFNTFLSNKFGHTQITNLRKIHCLMKCRLLRTCDLVIIDKLNNCEMKEINDLRKLLKKKHIDIYFKKEFNIENPVHFWPIENGTTYDTIGEAHMIAKNNVTFIHSRFNESQSAVRSFNGGYLSLKPDKYITGDFSFITWFRVSRIPTNEFKIINFETSLYKPDIAIFYSNDRFNCFLNKIEFRFSYSTDDFIDKWHHIALILNSQNLSMFLNGRIIGSHEIGFSPIHKNRSSCCISCNINATLTFFDLDDIKLFNISLNKKQISFDFYNWFNFFPK